MIPRAKLTNEIFGHPLKVRVSACRKRLRDHRGVQRAHDQQANSREERQPMAQFPADSAAVRQLVSVDLSPMLGDAQSINAGESVGEQEVGIT